MNSNKRILFLFIILLSIVIGSFLFSSVVNNSSFSKKINPKKRIPYNFAKILKEDFLTFKNNAIGFSIKYPAEMETRRYDANKLYFNATNNLNYVKDIDFSLVSQTTEGTELFDGLSMTLYYYPKATLDSTVPQKKLDNQNLQEGNITLREEVIINNIPGIKTHTCCWGGGTISYYFSINNRRDNQQAVLLINIFSVGPDKEKFNQIADKMIQSLEISN